MVLTEKNQPVSTLLMLDSLKCYSETSKSGYQKGKRTRINEKTKCI